MCTHTTICHSLIFNWCINLFVTIVALSTYYHAMLLMASFTFSHSQTTNYQMLSTQPPFHTFAMKFTKMKNLRGGADPPTHPGDYIYRRYSYSYHTNVT